MKKAILIFFTFFIAQITYGQSNKVESDTISEYEYWNYGMTFTIQGGLWKPVGNLDRTFNLNPNIGIKWGFPITKQLRIEAGTSINIPLSSEPFDYYINDDSSFIANSKNTVNGILGLWINHENRFGKKFFLDKYFGLGIGFIQTDKKKLNPTSENDNWYGVETVNFNFGLGIRKIAFRKRSIGIFFEYNFAPYPVFSRVNKNFGNSSIITGLLYRF